MSSPWFEEWERAEREYKDYYARQQARIYENFADDYSYNFPAPRSPERILADNREAYIRMMQGREGRPPGLNPTVLNQRRANPSTVQHTGYQPNRMPQWTAGGIQTGARGVGRTVGNVNYEAIAAFMNMSPQDQEVLRSQGLAPNIQTYAPGLRGYQAPGGIVGGLQDMGGGQLGIDPYTFAAARGQVGSSEDQARARNAIGNPQGPSHTWAAQLAQGRTSPVDRARQMGFTPSGPSANWSSQAMNFMNNFQQQNAINTGGAIDQLRQRAAASGDLDRLDYKEARLHRQLEGGRRSGMLNDMLGQVQLAQALGSAQGQSMGMQNYSNMFRGGG